jgi:succinyl-CoA synthetase beta subunit
LPTHHLKVESTVGTVNNFIVEPFLPHPSNTEVYVCINSEREGDNILFAHEGGVDIGDVDAKALKLHLPALASFPTRVVIKSTLLIHVPEAKKETLVDFIIRLYSIYVDLHFAYLEINPLICLMATHPSFTISTWRPSSIKPQTSFADQDGPWLATFQRTNHKLLSMGRA